jgi:uncharacterized protein (DUF1800 family)
MRVRAFAGLRSITAGVAIAITCGALQAQSSEEAAPPPDARQQKAAQTFAHSRRAAKPASSSVVLLPLTPRERVEQLLSRFTFGAPQGEVDRVLAMGQEAWLAQQLNPGSLNDGATDRRLRDFPTLSMSAAQAVLTFPDQGYVTAVADAKLPYPQDPLLVGVYEVQTYKLRQYQQVKKADGGVIAQPTETELAAQKKVDQQTADRVAGELFALPKQQRMDALMQMPVQDRIAFAKYLGGPQRRTLLDDMSPREREAFATMGAGLSAAYDVGNELAQARIVRDVMTTRQLQEVMTEFWFNHFNISLGKDSDQYLTTSYVRDTIRTHALGSFRDLLLATAESPAMMVYLDNFNSIGPDSQAGGGMKPGAKKSGRGLNENYGREVMELHTVGVNGGYTQADVTALSAILTGWTVDQPNRGGGFVFDPKKHEPGPKWWFGYEIADDGTILARGRPAAGTPTFGGSLLTGSGPANADSMKQGIEALTILANAPQTAHFISQELAQAFVADTPPASLVDRMAAAYMASHGDIKTVLRALISSPEFNSQMYFRNKVKTPVEFVASALRETGTDPKNPNVLVQTIRAMGMPLFYALPPTGYYLTADQWMNTTALVDRLNFAYQLTTGKLPGITFDASKLLATGLLDGQPAIADTAAEGAGASHMLHVAQTHGPEAAAPTISAGANQALQLFENALLGGTASPRTNQLIRAQIAKEPPTATADDTLNLLAALVMGSPDFQVR